MSTNPQSALAAYYARRAGEYEAIYAKAERQADLAALREWIVDQVRDKRVLELACGTGYWTAVAAPHAKAVDAFDLNDETLAIARNKGLPPSVQFAVGDAYMPLAGAQGHYDVVMAHFWWSHIPRAALDGFLQGMVALEPRAAWLFIDNAYADGSSTPLTRRDDAGNTYQQRTLGDGSTHEVLKNFPSAQELRAQFAHHERVSDITFTQYYWRACAKPTT